MPLIQFTKSFLNTNNSFKNESEKLAMLGHQNSRTVYFYISNKSSVEMAKKGLSYLEITWKD